ncbi:MAG TPA: Mur ligase family protein, partial [Thermogutta sp.]|nr:Mur ligase family protein [Thermogutta sp.]
VRIMDEEAAKRGESGPTYFEMLTAMAFLYFAQEKVDAAVIEVGLGGRLDSTNVCHPQVCVITTVSYDHMDLLGNSLEQIAWEKAGIIKRNLPVVSGVTQPGPRDVIRRVCQKRGCSLYELDRDFGVSYLPPRHLERDTALGNVTFWFQGGEGNGQRTWQEGQLRLLGSHQATNAAVAIMAVRCFQQRLGWRISDQAIQVALRETIVPARVEVLGRRPVVILDVAHNTASAQALVATVRECFDVRRRYLVFGTTQGKDYRGMLEVLAPHFDHIFLTQYTCNPRALPIEFLIQAAQEVIPTKFSVCPHPLDAWNDAWSRLTAEDLVCITGSFFLAAEMQPILREHGMMSAQSFLTRHSESV